MDGRKYRQIGTLLIGTILYVSAIFFCKSARGGMALTHMILDNSIDAVKVSSIQQQEAEEEEPAGFCFWGENPQQMVSCWETGGSAQVTQILLAGNPGLMDADGLAWQSGCLVDEQTARTLFGTTICGSQRLWHDGKSYPVLGTVSALRPTMVMMAQPESRLDHLVLSLPPEKGKVVGQQCMIRWGVSGTVLDFFLLWSLVNNILLLFPMILIVRLCAYLAKDWREITVDGILYGEQWRLLGKCVFAAAIAAAALLLLSRRVILPKNMIPSQWSDFSFWGKWWESEKENAIQILFASQGNSQLQMRMNMVKSIVSSTAACMAALWPVRRYDRADTAD